MSKEVAALIAVGVVIIAAIQIWLWKSPAPNCCEHFGFNCREGRDCPFRKDKHEHHH